MLSLAAVGGFFLVVAALLAVDFVSWLRTRPLRRGAITQACDPPGNTSLVSSRTTLLATLAGMAAMASGGVVATASGGVAEGGPSFIGIPLVAVGLFIAVAGSVARVTGFRARDDGLVVVFARRPPFRAPWAEVLSLKPPASPLGGWRVADARGARSTLMPSDLFGHEDLLVLIVRRAGLRFDGRLWIQDSAALTASGTDLPGVSLLGPGA
jgi:hypothetical protein